MAAVLPACLPEFLAEGPVRNTAPAPLNTLDLMTSGCAQEMFAASTYMPPPPPIDGVSAWAISEKNTFLSIEAPEQPPLLRSRTDPLKVHAVEEASVEASGSDLSAPPALTLEYFATEDHYGSLPEAASDFDEVPAPPGLVAPPPLSLEFVETDDPFRRTPAAAERLGFLVPPPLSLEYVPTDDPFRCTPTAADVSAPPAPPQLTLEYVATDDPFRVTPKASGYMVAGDSLLPATECADMVWPPGLAPPPPIQLESFDTEDPFENPLQLLCVSGDDSFRQASEPAFIPLPSRPAQCGPPPPPMAPAPLIGTPSPLPPPPPPAQMPLTPAPELEAPQPELEAPKAQPGHTPGTGVTALGSTDLRQAGLLTRPATSAGCTHVHWAVDARKLEGQDKQAVSQVFMVELPGHGPTPFKLVLYPKATNDSKHGAGFKKAKGRGRVVLKCEAQLPENLADVSFRVGVGRAGASSETLQAFRGPVRENFFEHSCHGLPKSEEDWDFSASVDDSRTFLVTLEIAPTAAFHANPGIWWEPLQVVEKQHDSERA